MAEPQHYSPGNVVRLLATFSQVAAGLVDPATVNVYVWMSGDPNAPGSPLTPIHDGLGEFHYDYLIPMDTTPGTWIGRVNAAGGAPDATSNREITFIVDPLNA